MNLDLAVIGWCKRDGIKQLLCDNGFTVSPGEDGESYDRAIEMLCEECKKKGTEFPEFTWDGYKWVKVSQNKQAL